MSSGDRDNFVLSFPVWMPFISFSCLIALAGTFSTMLRKATVRVVTLVLFLILEEKLTQIFFPYLFIFFIVLFFFFFLVGG